VPRYAARAGEVAITPEQLAAAIHALVEFRPILALAHFDPLHVFLLR
jgi:hypothetical protein